ncbi:MAG TPA: outer membrane beta-barrel protein [Longimicrobium sp.]|nr:outer membrane beta-barrel protein [Longimicrobium sp.]
MSPTLRRCALTAILVPLLPALAAAQNVPNRPAISLSGGARLYDAADNDTRMMTSVSIRSELPLTRIFVLELAGSVADLPDRTISGATTLLESQLQLAFPVGEVLTPYAGAGVGFAQIKRFGDVSDADEWQAIFTAGLGARVALSDNLGVVADARIRGRGSEIGSHMDVTVGLRYAFGRPDRPRFRGGRR